VAAQKLRDHTSPDFEAASCSFLGTASQKRTSRQPFLMVLLWPPPSSERLMRRRFPLVVAALILLAVARTAAAQETIPNAAAAAEVRARFMADLDTLESKFLRL